MSSPEPGILPGVLGAASEIVDSGGFPLLQKCGKGVSRKCPTLSASILRSDPGAFHSRCFPRIVLFHYHYGSVSEARKRRYHRCGNLKLHHLILWFWFSSTTQVLSCALSSLVLTPPPKAPVFPGQVGRRNQGWLALIDCEEVKDGHLGSKLVFFYVRWG